VHGLYAWLRRNPMLVDGVLALLVLVAGSSFFPKSWIQDPLVLLVMVGLAVPVVFRRRYPVGAFAAVIAIGIAQLVVTRAPSGADVAVMVLLYTLAATQPRRSSLLGLAACLVGAVVGSLRWGVTTHTRPSVALTMVGLLSVLPLVAWLVGDSVRWRRGYYAALEERARRLERERDAFAQVAAASERARIAREMHDVVAHHVSVMVVQADGAAFALDRSPEQARQAIGAISRTGRQALAELRRLLGVLRSPENSAKAGALGPMPGLADLTDLLAQTEAGGIPVAVTVAGAPRPLSGGADLAAYRIVQESLTNALRHAGPTTARVTLSYTDDELQVDVVDGGRGRADGTPHGAGHGIAGMRERAEAIGGTVIAGPAPEGGFGVHARLPLSPP
jgi:signal transduction histidine kinase